MYQILSQSGFVDCISKKTFWFVFLVHSVYWLSADTGTVWEMLKFIL